MDDWQLLRKYVDHGSQDAFATLVEKHRKMVYWTCRRDVQDPQMAEDVTQTVFVLLAQKAASIKRCVTISGWLFTTSRLAARNARRSETRRRLREEAAAHAMQEQMTDAGWSRVETWLNDGLSKLPRSDREAILMRYFDDLSLPEIALALAITEATARKRLSRATERLRLYLLRKDVPVSVASLTTMLAQFPAPEVPAGHSATMLEAVHHALANPPTVASGLSHTLHIKNGVVHLMEVATRKAVIAGVAVALLGLGVIVPLAIGHARHAEAAAPAGKVHFVDLTSSGTSAAAGIAPVEAGTQDGSGAAADRVQVVATLREALDAVANRDLSRISAVTTPDYTATFPGIGALNRGQVLAGNQQTFALLAQFDVDCTLQSLQINGDDADLTTRTELHGTTNQLGNVPAGTKLEQTSVVETHMKKIGGKWLEASSTALSRDLTLNGHPVPNR